MVKRVAQILMIQLLVATLAIPAVSQDCGVILSCAVIIDVDRDGASTFNVPVNIYNNCKGDNFPGTRSIAITKLKRGNNTCKPSQGNGYFRYSF